MQNTVALFSAIGALITALATLAVVWEMTRQRAAIHHPDLAVLPAHIYAIADPELGLLITDSPLLSKQSDRGFLGNIPGVAVSIVNLGVAPAKDLCLEWQFDALDFASIISTHDSKQQFEIYFDERSTQGSLSLLEIVNKKQQGFLTGIHNLTRQANDRIAYLLPISGGAAAHVLRLPPAYVSLFRVLAFVGVGVREPWPRPPLLRLILQYKDIHGSTYRSEYVLQPEYIFLVRETQERAVPNGRTEVKTIMNGIIDVQKVS